jgi:hypothetical protein
VGSDRYSKPLELFLRSVFRTGGALWGLWDDSMIQLLSNVGSARFGVFSRNCLLDMLFWSSLIALILLWVDFFPSFSRRIPELQNTPLFCYQNSALELIPK